MNVKTNVFCDNAKEWSGHRENIDRKQCAVTCAALFWQMAHVYVLTGILNDACGKNWKRR